MVLPAACTGAMEAHRLITNSELAECGAPGGCQQRIGQQSGSTPHEDLAGVFFHVSFPIATAAKHGRTTTPKGRGIISGGESASMREHTQFGVTSSVA